MKKIEIDENQIPEILNSIFGGLEKYKEQIVLPTGTSTFKLTPEEKERADSIIKELKHKMANKTTLPTKNTTPFGVLPRAVPKDTLEEIIKKKEGSMRIDQHYKKANDKEFLVLIPLPGVPKDAISSKLKEKGDYTVLIVEINKIKNTSKLSAFVEPENQMFSIPEGYDTKNPEIKYENGLLIISFAKVKEKENIRTLDF